MSYRYEPYMNFASLDQITRVINSINQSKIFGWSNEEKDKVLSHIVHKDTGLIVGYVGDESLELCHYPHLDLEERTKIPREQLSALIDKIIPINERFSWKIEED